MTNLDMIKDMPVGQMADFLLNRGRCTVCVHFVDNECECEETPVPCYDGVIKWLNKDINPMPSFELADVIETVNNRYVVIESNTVIGVKGKYCEKQPAYICPIDDVLEHETVSIIWRYIPGEKVFEKIWRAE